MLLTRKIVMLIPSVETRVKSVRKMLSRVKVSSTDKEDADLWEVANPDDINTSIFWVQEAIDSLIVLERRLVAKRYEFHSKGE
jgi:hypothetical protein